MKKRRVCKIFRLLKQTPKWSIPGCSGLEFRLMCPFHGSSELLLDLIAPVILRAPCFHFANAGCIDLFGVLFQVSQLSFYGFICDPVQRCKIHTGIGTLIVTIFSDAFA